MVEVVGLEVGVVGVGVVEVGAAWHPQKQDKCTRRSGAAAGAAAGVAAGAAAGGVVPEVGIE